MNRHDTTAALAATQPEALRLAIALEHSQHFYIDDTVLASEAAAELRRLLALTTAAPAAQEAEPAPMPAANDLQGALAAAAIGVNSVIHRIGAGNADGALDVAARVKGAIAQAIAFAREADAGAAPEGWRELAARVMDALAEAQERTNRECPRHVECYPGWVTHARWLRWHAEMFRTGRPIGNGAGQPEVLAALAAVPQAPAAAVAPAESAADSIASAVCRQVAELPDRDSPESWPKAMLVTGEELYLIVVEAVSAAASTQEAAPLAQAGEGGARP